MRDTIRQFVELGPLPDEEADSAQLSRHQALLDQIYRSERPVTDSEARAMVGLFGSDDCYGLAWTLLHIIETAPGWPLQDCLRDDRNEWVRRLRERAERLME